MLYRMLILLVMTAALLTPVAAQDAPPDDDAGVTAVLNDSSYWRWNLVFRQPVGGEGDTPAFDHLATFPPPADWTGADFDDSSWNRSRLGWFRQLVLMSGHREALSVRGKFTITDPAAAGDLMLTFSYAGGAVVCLNGREIARGHLPKGELTVDTPADPYPAEAYRNIPRKPSKEFVEQLRNLRDRSVGPIKLPADALRKGVNVLTIQVLRSEKTGGGDKAWQALDLWGVKLTATGGGVTPNVNRPDGLQIWNHDRNDRVTILDYGDPNEPLRPMTIVAARNGSFCGQVVVTRKSNRAPGKDGADDPADLVAPKAVAGDLVRKHGDGVIPASNVTLLYGRTDWPSRHYPTWVDGLTPTPPKVRKVHEIARWQKPSLPEAAILPIIARVKVPADATPGDYTGKLTFSAKGVDPVDIPVDLHVSAWRIPDPADYRTYIGFYQSPTSLALQYEVEPWSEQHWKLVENSFAMLSRVGNQMVNVHAVDQTQFGNDRGMIRWVRQADGSFTYDFTIFDRFMKLATKYMPSLDHVAVHVWHSGGWETRKADEENTVTVVDARTGEISRLQVPNFATDEAEAFWKPVLAAVHQRLDKLGLADAMCLGILSDGTAPESVFAMFDKAWPGEGPAKWMRGCHTHTHASKPYRASKGGGAVVLHEYCYGLGYHDPSDLPPLYNRDQRPGAAYHRISGHESAATIVWYRTFPEQSLFRNTKGVGRVCFDFFDVIKTRQGKTWIYNRYPHSSCAQRAPSLQSIVWAGPDGAETTIRYEAFAEGVQTAEAVIVLSEAVHEHADALGPDLLARCKKMLANRLNFARYRDQMQWARSYFHMNNHGWQRLDRELFGLAAEVSNTLGPARPDEGNSK